MLLTNLLAIFFSSKFVFDQNFLTKSFLDQNIFGPNIFDQTVFIDQKTKYDFLAIILCLPKLFYSSARSYLPLTSGWLEVSLVEFLA